MHVEIRYNSFIHDVEKWPNIVILTIFQHCLRILNSKLIKNITFPNIAKHCYHGEYRCDDGNCIPLTYVCNGKKDCHDNTDESICKNVTVPHPTCELGHWQCNDGDCIRALWKCDGTNDCADESDEKGCGESAF